MRQLKHKPSEQEKIYKSLLESPPETLYFLCDTKDRKEQFQIVKTVLFLVKESLKSYFNGIEYQLYVDLNHLKNCKKTKLLYKKHKKNIEALRDLFLSLYDIIYHCWEQIKNQLNKIDLIARGLDLTPGTILSLIINDFSICLLRVAFPEHIPNYNNFYSEFSPRIWHDKGRKYHDLIQKASRGETLSNKEKSFLKNNKSKFKASKNNIEPFENWINFIRQCAIKSKDRKMKSRLEILDEAIRELNSLFFWWIHPRNSPRKSTWNKGQLKYL